MPRIRYMLLHGGRLLRRVHVLALLGIFALAGYSAHEPVGYRGRANTWSITAEPGVVEVCFRETPIPWEPGGWYDPRSFDSMYPIFRGLNEPPAPSGWFSWPTFSQDPGGSRPGGSSTCVLLFWTVVLLTLLAGLPLWCGRRRASLVTADAQTRSGPYRPAGYCRRCEYPVDPGRCPECGTVVASDRLLKVPRRARRPALLPPGPQRRNGNCRRASL